MADHYKTNSDGMGVCVSHESDGRSRQPSECLNVAGDEHSVPVIWLMEADLQVQTTSAGFLGSASITPPPPPTHKHKCQLSARELYYTSAHFCTVCRHSTNVSLIETVTC